MKGPLVKPGRGEERGIKPLVPAIAEFLVCGLALNLFFLSRIQERSRAQLILRPVHTAKEAALSLAAGRQWPELLALIEAGKGVFSSGDAATFRRQARRS